MRKIHTGVLQYVLNNLREESATAAISCKIQQWFFKEGRTEKKMYGPYFDIETSKWKRFSVHHTQTH